MRRSQGRGRSLPGKRRSRADQWRRRRLVESLLNAFNPNVKLAATQVGELPSEFAELRGFDEADLTKRLCNEGRQR